ncbi:MAG: SRPBCC family protein [Nannocystaceae bacterium]
MAFLHIDSFCQTDEVSAPVADVFQAFTEIETWPTWISALAAARTLSEGPLRVGFRFELTFRNFPRPFQTELIDYTPNKVFAWGTEKSLYRLRHAFDFEAQTPTTCTLRHSESSGGLLAIPAYLLAKKIRNTNSQWSADVVQHFRRESS